jgi:hypothetical protein
VKLFAETKLPERATSVFLRARDDLHAIGSFMPDVAYVQQVRSRSGLESVERVDRLGAQVAPLRLAGRSFSEARWLLYSSWHEPSTSVRWQVEVEHPVNALHCEGTIAIADDASGEARITIAGSLGLRLEAVGLRLLGSAFSGGLERLIASRIESNLRSLFEAMRPAAG